MRDNFIWHPASGSARIKGRSWFVVRELRQPDEKGLRYRWHETEKGNLHTYPTMEAAQKVADKLNEKQGMNSWLTDEQLKWWHQELQPPHGSSSISSGVRKTMLALIDEVTYVREN